MYTPLTASGGTAQRAETAQLPQSTSPVAGSVCGGGCCCGSAAQGRTSPTFRAPFPP